MVEIGSIKKRFLGKIILGTVLMSSMLLSVVWIQPVSAFLTWSSSTNYPVVVGGESCVVDSVFVYCVAGGSTGVATTDAVYFASLSASGVGAWSATTKYPIAVSHLTCVASSGFVYCVGGETNIGGATNTVYFAPLSSTGVGSWTATTSYPFSVFGQSCVASSGFVYCIAGWMNGFTRTNAVYFAPISSSGVGSWSPTTNYAAVTWHSCVAHSGYVYCVGGLGDFGLLNAVSFASLSPSGVGAWLSTTSYPLPIFNESCVATAGSIFCVGGNSDGNVTPGPTTNLVYVASLFSNQVAAWSGTTAYPLAIETQSCVASVSRNLLYCIGGDKTPSASNDQFINAVYFAPTSPGAVDPVGILSDANGRPFWNGLSAVSWGSWQFLNGSSPSPPGLCRSGSGTFELVVRGLDDGIYHRSFVNGAWSTAWDSLGGLTHLQPACSVAGNTLYAAVTGLDDQPYVTSKVLPNGAWATWTGLGGSTLSSPAIVATSAPARVDVVVQGQDQGLYHKASIGGGPWSATWDSAGGIVTDIPVALSDGDGVAVIARGALLPVFPFGMVYGIYYNKYLFATGWTGWTTIGHGSSSPSATRDSSGALHVVVKDDGGNTVKHVARPSGGNFLAPASWDILGGGYGSRPVIAATTSVLVILYRLTDNSIYTDILQNGTWLGWVSAGGSSTIDPSLPYQ